MSEESLQRGRRLAKLAERQHGVVSVRQLKQLGYSKDRVAGAAAAGWLHRLHTGVYAVGHTDLSPYGQCLAAVLGSGPGALLSHYSAAWLWGLSTTQPLPIHVTTPLPRGRRLPIRIHRSSTLTEADRGLRVGIPVTSVARTLLDQAPLVPRRRLRRLVKEAEQRKVFDLGAVHDVLARNKGHRGTRPLRSLIRHYEPPPFTRSDFETAFYEAVLAGGLPRPRVNYNLVGMEVDMYWPAHRLAVELDTYETHGSRDSFEEDHLRQEELMLEGIAVAHVTGTRFAREPKAVITRLARLLADRASP